MGIASAVVVAWFQDLIHGRGSCPPPDCSPSRALRKPPRNVMCVVSPGFTAIPEAGWYPRSDTFGLFFSFSHSLISSWDYFINLLLCCWL